MRAFRVAGVALVAAALASLLVVDAAIQIDPDVRDRVVPAAVQVAVLATERVGAAESVVFFPVGSGTIVSPDGLVLTNQHVIDEAGNRTELERFAAHEPGEATYDLVPDRLLLLATGSGVAPEPRWEAEVVAQDEQLDLAVLRVVADQSGHPVALAELNLPHVELGDSDALQLGDPIDVFGYPAAGGESLTFTSGFVSGFNAEAGIDGRAWIKTDAVISGGSSGGTAVNRAGRLVGVPTRGANLDCRPGDTNGDGVTDEADVGCVPTGGSIGELRPVNLARPLLEEAGLRPQAATSEVRETPTPIPIPTMEALPVPDWVQPTIPPDHPCNSMPFYPEGTVVTIVTGVQVRAGPSAESDFIFFLIEGTQVVIAGDFVDDTPCDWWPILVPDTGQVGFVLERFLRPITPSLTRYEQA